MQCPALIDERAFPFYASTIKMTEKKNTTHIFNFVLFCGFITCNMGLSLGSKSCIKD